MFGIKRPKSIDDKTWEKYQEDVTAKVLLLEKQGWPIESIKEFGKYFKEMLGRKCQSSDMSDIQICNILSASKIHSRQLQRSYR